MLSRAIRFQTRLIPTLSFLFLGLLATAPGVRAAGPFEIQLATATGDHPPLMDGSVVFKKLENSQVNALNQVAFAALVGTPAADSSDSAWGIFVRDESGLRKILFDGDPLPGGDPVAFDLPNQPLFRLNDNGAIVIVISSRGVLLHRDGMLQWLVQTGDSAPGTGSTFASFLFSGPLNLIAKDFNNADEVVLVASLADGSQGIFLAGGIGTTLVARMGQPLPDRESLELDFPLSSLTLRGSWVSFQALAGEKRGLFRFSRGDGLRTIAIEGDDFPEVGKIETLLEGDISERGTAALSILTASPLRSVVLLGMPGGLSAVLESGNELAGFPGPAPQIFRFLTLDDKDRLFFLAERGQTAGYYLWENGDPQKIAADGDISPAGGTFVLGLYPPLALSPLNRSYDFAGINNSRGFAFSAFTAAGGQNRLFLWNSGSLIYLPAEEERFTGLGDRLLDNLSPRMLSDSGALLSEGPLCCGERGKGLFLTQPTPPRQRYLPVAAVGRSSDGLRLQTAIDLFNYSDTTGFARLDVYDRQGNILSQFSDILAAGQTLRRTVEANREPTTGYARLVTEGGADIGFQGVIRLSNLAGLISQTTVGPTIPTNQARLVAESDQEGNSGITLTNPAETSADYVLRLSDRDGGELFVLQLSLAPNTQQSLFVNELFPDLEQPFLGTLDIRSETPFLAAGLRQAELQLSTLPVDDSPQPDPFRQVGFVNLYPALPPSSPDVLGTEFLKDVLTGPDGSVAILTQEGEVRLIQGEESFAVLDLDSTLPEVDATVEAEPEVRLLGFLSNGALVVEASFESTFDGQPLVLSGLFQFSQRRLEKLYLAGDSLPDGTFINIEESIISPDGRLLLIGHSFGGASFWSFDGQALNLLHSEVSGFPFRELDFGRAGRIAFQGGFARERLEIIEDGQRKTIVRVGDSISGRFKIGAFQSLELGPDNRLFFTAYSDDPPTFGQLTTGFFVFDGQQTRLLLMTGDPAPGRPHVAMDSLILNGASTNFQVNSSGKALLLATFLAESGAGFEGERHGFVLVDEQFGTETIVLEDQDFPDPRYEVNNNSPFAWDDADRLLFEARRSGPVATHRGVFLWEDEGIDQLVEDGDRLSRTTREPLSLVRSIHQVWRMRGGQALFQARIAGQDTSGLYAASLDNPQRGQVLVVNGEFPPLDYETSVILYNPDDREASVRTLLFDSDGLRQPSLPPLLLAPGEVRRLAIETPESFSGWARVDVRGGSIQVFSRFSARREGKLFSEVTVPGAIADEEGFWPDAQRVPAGRDNGVAVANPYNAPIQVRIDLLGPGIGLQRQIGLTIPANGQRTLLSSQFPLDGCCVGIIRLQSDLPVPAVSLRLNDLRITSQPIFH